MPGQGLWQATAPHDVSFEHRLDISLDLDVAIVGAGYTGLWTALALLEAEPAMRITVVERHHVGFGASGRNGGWCSALLPISLTALERRHGRGAAIDWQRAMITTVDEVGRFAASSAANGRDTQFHNGGTLTVARNPAQMRRIESAVAEARRFGFGTDDVRLLEDSEAAARIHTAGLVGAMFTPHCAAVHPLRLARAIAAAAARLGARIVEGVDVVDVQPRRVTTTAGTIRADAVVVATEAYTSQLPGRRRDVLPIYSMMIGSEPLNDTQWAAIGLAHRETFTVATHVVVYGQRTADGRMAFGGRGAPYHFGSRVADRFDTDDGVRSALRRTVTELFPALGDIDFPFHWGGALAAPRDWHPHVTYDRVTGVASAGGYVGDGVATANLAGRTLADLILERRSDLTRLPWVGHRSRRWEPEPARWLGVRLVAAAAARADRAEAGSGPYSEARAAAWTKLVDTFIGR
ncbi:MAG: glycine/D-amino acid oxidase [Desertimonas sp.]|nr:glycine/D-amino acid oxidase [Desertimonas sp.]